MEELERRCLVLTADVFKSGATDKIRIFAVSNEGPVEAFWRVRPYLFAANPSAEIAKNLPPHTKDSKSYTTLGHIPVSKLIFENTESFEVARTLLQNQGISVYESDIRARDRFLMDARINGFVRLRGTAKKLPYATVFEEPEFSTAPSPVNLRVCSLDIETSMSTGEILSVGFHNWDGTTEQHCVLMQGTSTAEDPPLRGCGSERELLHATTEYLHAWDPDIVIGWNVIGFDLQFLLKRAERLGVTLDWGRGKRRFFVSESTGRFSRAYIAGRVVLDGPQLLRASFFNFESYSLQNVAQGVLGDSKLLTGENRGWEIERLFREDPKALAAYNLKDCVLVSEIFKKLNLLELSIRRMELSGMLLEQTGLSVAAFDHFYLPRLHDEGFVAPDVVNVESGSAAGGHVFTPRPGVYDRVVSFDFKSLYPSIIRTFKIDPLSRAVAHLDPVTTPKGYRFSRTRSILPAFLAELMSARAQAKQDNNAPLSQAIKILMNSFYGVMGSGGSRLSHPELADAITSTGHWVLHQARSWFEERGHLVLYGDTDSLFVQPNVSKDASIDEWASNSARDLTHWLTEVISNEFGLLSYLELDLRRVYDRLILPLARDSETGAKKRYAGYYRQHGEERYEFIGLEVVRSDWTSLARKFQQELYTKVFKSEPLDEWLRVYVTNLRTGVFDNELEYRKKLHKDPSEYGPHPPPYVRAAQMLGRPTRRIRYIMTKKGPVPSELNPSGIDYDHYVDKQLRPIADSLLELFGKNFSEVLSPQLRLF